MDCVEIAAEDEVLRVTVAVRNPVDEDMATTGQVPNLVWHPALQYAFVLPHLKIIVSLYLVYESLQLTIRIANSSYPILRLLALSMMDC
jgi:hypothetical protein